MPKLKVAVIGCGFWGLNHARVFKEIKQAELIAVSDIDESRAKLAGDKYRIDWYTDNTSLLSRKDLEAVSICTPSSTHTEVALEAIEKGKNLLVEKPLATSAREALKVIKAAEEANVRIMVGHIERFNPGVRRVKALIEEGRVGGVLLASSKRVSMWPTRVGDVGVVKDLAIHDVDVMRYLLNKEPMEVYAIVGSLKRSFEEYAHIILKFPPREVGFIESNWLTPYKVRKLIVTCTGGIITLDYITQQVTIDDSRGSYTPYFQWEEPLRLELQNFVNSLLRKEKFEVEGRDGYRALRIVEDALTSASQRTPVKIIYED